MVWSEDEGVRVVTRCDTRYPLKSFLPCVFLSVFFYFYLFCFCFVEKLFYFRRFECDIDVCDSSCEGTWKW